MQISFAVLQDVVTVNPEDEVSVSIQDGAGRTIASGNLARNGDLLTCRTVKYDATGTVTGFGDCVETAQIVRTTIDQITPANDVLQTTESRADGAGRTLETIDALNYVTSMQYDANGNKTQLRDLNSVGGVLPTTRSTGRLRLLTRKSRPKARIARRPTMPTT